ncbi:MAG: contact-dependent growth inhibition system immunity protein [Gaiellaceae bacterium]
MIVYAVVSNGLQTWRIHAQQPTAVTTRNSPTTLASHLRIEERELELRGEAAELNRRGDRLARVGWWAWLNFVLTVLLVVGAVALLWARRYKRREREAARRKRERRLADWQFIEWPEMPQTLPKPGTTRLDGALAYELEGSDEFEELRQFFGGYFHQDWHDEFDDEDDAVRGYVEGHAHLPEDVVELLHGMDKLLAFGLSDDDLQRALDALGSEYYAFTDTNLWLRNLRAKVLVEAKGD